MRGRVHARRTLKGLVADLRQVRKYKELTVNVRWYEERANYSECISVGNLFQEVTKRVYFIGNERMLIAHDSNRLRFS